ncbi:MAG: DNA-binding protein [Pseudomonadota bacterium]
MGRQATISIDDVKDARAALVAAQKPHGIIAIRRKIGRGSPQLIAKFLRELGVSTEQESALSKQRAEPLTGVQSAGATRLEPPKADSLSQAWNSFAFQVDQSITELQTGASSSGRNTPARLDQLEHLVAAQQQQLSLLRDQNQKLGEQLMHQQDLFDSWRHEQHAERQMLKHQLDELNKLASRKTPGGVKRKRGEQLDLYGNPDDS